MTIGIYALYWAEQDLVYVGKSNNLPKRKYEHFRLLKNSEHTVKLQGAYNSYGPPEFHILCTCAEEELDSQEISWIAEFNALDSLNKVPGGQSVGKDTTHASSKFTKEQILAACELLSDYKVSQKEVAELTGISEAVISTILNGTRHTWIPKELREQLNSVKSLRYAYHQPNSKSKNYCIESPTGIVYNNILSITDFAKEHHLLGTKLNEVLRGKRPHHLGWKIPTNK